jgi:acylphosphatase
MKAYDVRLTGKVQGVYFRASAKAEADRLGVRGWVKNLSDGGVQLFIQHAEGASLEQMLAWCDNGPRGAEVTWRDVRETTPDGSLKGFEVR